MVPFKNFTSLSVIKGSLDKINLVAVLKRYFLGLRKETFERAVDIFSIYVLPQ